MGQHMSRLNIPNGQIRLFGSPVLESLTVVSARVFIALWAILLPAILIGAAVYAPTVWAPLLIVLGVLGWTLAEYALHRFVFHFEARSSGLKRAIFVIHGNHHAAPNDPLRNLMPPIVSIPVGGLIGLLLVSVIGPEGAWCFFGFMLGYVSYDLVHYACHQWPMKSRLARILKVHHMRHHHLRAKGNYAITGMAWDRILSTRIVSPGERG
jgi:sterol desaturase/sphingolipid hydroxylase (fatty acid hydroxylase superfamily)